MKRRIVQHGSSSLTVTLPIKWAEKYKIRKGDEVDVEENGSTILISTQKEFSDQKKEVSTSEYGMFTKNNLSHLYQLGYDDIEIRFENSYELEEIKKRVPNCIGFEIIDQKENKVHIKSIATTLESEFDTLLRKSFQVTNEMARSILEILEGGQYQKLREIRNMESLNNKFTDACIRILSKKGYKVQNRTMQIYEIIKNIERIADEFKYICDLFSDYKGKTGREMMKLFGEAVDYYMAFYNMFYKFDAKLKRKIYLDRKEIMRKCMKQMKKSKGKEALFIHNIMNIVEKTYEGAGGYFALVL